MGQFKGGTTIREYIVVSAKISTLSAISVMAQTNPVPAITPIMTDTSTARAAYFGGFV